MRSRNVELPLAVEIHQTEEQLHICDGLVTAMQEPRAVLDVILEAADIEAARGALQMRLDLDEIQVSGVLDMQLRRATERDRGKIGEHRHELAEHLQSFGPSKNGRPTNAPVARSWH